MADEENEELPNFNLFPSQTNGEINGGIYKKKAATKPSDCRKN